MIRPVADEDRHPILVTVAVMLAALMQVLDTTIVNVALPSMAGMLSATQDQIAWVLTSYVVASAIMTAPTGWLAGRFGRRRVFMTAIASFTVASFLCGIAGSLTEIVVFRLLQGLAGAALVPLSQAILLDTYPREKHGVAMAIFGIGVILGPILGPTLGGYLTDLYSWRWVFFINLPVGVLAFTMVGTYVPGHDSSRPRPLDLYGFALLSLGIGALQLMLDRGQGQDWFSSMEIIIEAGIAGTAFYLYLVHAGFAKHPFVDLHLFRDRNFSIGVMLMFVMGVILLATMALIPPMVQALMGYPEMLTGLVLAPRGMGAMVSMILVSRLISRMDPRILVTTGFALMGGASWLMGSLYNLQMDTFTLVWTGILQGLGMGLIFVPLSTLAFSTLPAELRNEGTAVFNLMRNIGMSIGVSLVFTLLTRNIQINHAGLAAAITPWNENLALTPLLQNGDTAMQLLNGEITRQAAMVGYVYNFHFLAMMILLIAPLILLMRRPKYA